MRRGITFIILLLAITLSHTQDWRIENFDQPLSHLPELSAVDTTTYEGNGTVTNTYNDTQQAALIAARDEANATLAEELVKNSTIASIYVNVTLNKDAADLLLSALRAKLTAALVVTTDVHILISHFLNVLRTQFTLRVAERYYEVASLYASLQSKFVDCKTIEVTLLEDYVAMIAKSVELVTACKTALPNNQQSCTINNLLTLDLTTLITDLTLRNTIQEGLTIIQQLNDSVNSNKDAALTCYSELHTMVHEDASGIHNYTQESADEAADKVLLNHLVTQVRDKVEQLKSLTFDGLLAFVSVQANVDAFLELHFNLVARVIEGTLSVTATINTTSNEVVISLTHTHNGTISSEAQEILANVHLAAFKALSAIRDATVSVPTYDGNVATLTITIVRSHVDWIRNSLNWVRDQTTDIDVDTAVAEQLAILDAEINDSATDFQTKHDEAQATLDSLIANTTSNAENETTVAAARAEAAANETVNETVSTEQEVLDHAAAVYAAKRAQVLADLQALKTVFDGYVLQAKVNFYSNLVILYSELAAYKDSLEEKYNQSAHDARLLVASAFAFHERNRQIVLQIDAAILYHEQNGEQEQTQINTTAQNIRDNVTKTVEEIRADFAAHRELYSARIIAFLQSFLRVSSPVVVYNYLDNVNSPVFQIDFNLDVTLSDGQTVQQVRDRVKALLVAIVKLVTGVVDVSIVESAKRETDSNTYTVQVGSGSPPVQPQPESLTTTGTPVGTTTGTPVGTTTGTPVATTGTPVATPKASPVAPKSPVTPKTPVTPTPKASPTGDSSGAVNYVSLFMLLVALLALLF